METYAVILGAGLAAVLAFWAIRKLSKKPAPKV
jgi:hypothetical protein